MLSSHTCLLLQPQHLVLNCTLPLQFKISDRGIDGAPVLPQESLSDFFTIHTNAPSASKWTISESSWYEQGTGVEMRDLQWAIVEDGSRFSNNLYLLILQTSISFFTSLLTLHIPFKSKFVIYSSQTPSTCLCLPKPTSLTFLQQYLLKMTKEKEKEARHTEEDEEALLKSKST